MQFSPAHATKEPTTTKCAVSNIPRIAWLRSSTFFDFSLLVSQDCAVKKCAYTHS